MSTPHDHRAASDRPEARIAHVALWTRDVEQLERLREFYERHLGARAGAIYHSARQPGFASYFLDFAGGARLELMALPHGAAPDATPAANGARPGYAHIALSLGSTDAVVAVTARLAAAGVHVHSAPRWTGDGYYESVVADPDGNLVELTV